jgi:hypothetical protein
VLHFVSDRTEWWNLYREEPDGTARNLTPLEAEFGVPQWEFGYATYAFLSDGRIACVYRRDGVHHLGMLDPVTSELLDLDLPYVCFDPPYMHADGTRIAFVGSSSTEPPGGLAASCWSKRAAVLPDPWPSAVITTTALCPLGKYQNRGKSFRSEFIEMIMLANSRCCSSACGMATLFRFTQSGCTSPAFAPKNRSSDRTGALPSRSWFTHAGLP